MSRRSALHTLVVDSLPAPIAIMDADARIIDVNSAWRELLAESEQARHLVDHSGSFFDLLAAVGLPADEHRAELVEGLREVLAQRQDSFRIEHSMRVGAHERWFMLRISRLGALEPALFVSSHVDITERRHAEEEALRLSRRDPLTGIGNRRLFEENLGIEVRRASRNGTPVSLIEVDIDNFKEFNDWHGHVVGDQCLVRVATVLAACARRPGDLAARLGGDEFALILGETGAQAARRIAETARRAVAALEMRFGPMDTLLTASVGVATLESRRTDGQQILFEAADRALYRAKSGGRNRVEHEDIGDEAQPSS